MLTKEQNILSNLNCGNSSRHEKHYLNNTEQLETVEELILKNVGS